MNVESAQGRILAVDDDHVCLRLLEQLLSSGGYEVVTSVDPEQALRFIQEGPAFDVVLVDLFMPGSDSLDFARRARVYAPRPVTIFYLMTAQSSLDRDYAALYEAGFDQYLPKPYDLTATLANVSLSIQQKIVRGAFLPCLPPQQSLPLSSPFPPLQHS